MSRLKASLVLCGIPTIPPILALGSLKNPNKPEKCQLHKWPKFNTNLVLHPLMFLTFYCFDNWLNEDFAYDQKKLPTSICMNMEWGHIAEMNMPQKALFYLS